MLPTTYLFVPADRPDRFAKALGSGADRVILDLEDAVRPEDKAAARRAVATARLDWARVVVRVNPAGSGLRAADMEALAGTGVRAVMVPKAEEASDLAAVAEATGAEVLPQVETARGLAALPSLLAAPGVRRAAFGHLDFALDIGAQPTWEAMLHARSSIVLASRLAGRDAPIDSVTTDLADAALAGREARGARALGFGGKLLIHPRQIPPVSAAFAPSGEEIAWAERVVAAASGAAGAVQVDGRMIDAPVEEAARRILAAVSGTGGGAHA